MYRIVLGMAAVATMAVGAETASAQAPAVQTFPQTYAPLSSQPVYPVVGGTIVSPGVGYVAPPTVVVPSLSLGVGLGYPYGYGAFYGRPYGYYPRYYHRHW